MCKNYSKTLSSGISMVPSTVTAFLTCLYRLPAKTNGDLCWLCIPGLRGWLTGSGCVGAIHLLSAVWKWVCLRLDTGDREQFFSSSLTVFGRFVDSVHPKIEMPILQSFLPIPKPDQINLCFCCFDRFTSSSHALSSSMTVFLSHCLSMHITHSSVSNRVVHLKTCWKRKTVVLRLWPNCEAVRWKGVWKPCVMVVSLFEHIRFS